MGKTRKSLDLSNQGNAILDFAWEDYIRIKELNLSNNQLVALPDWVRHLHFLEVLSLSHNAIATFPSSISQFKNLRMVNLSGNQLNELGEPLSDFPKMRVLLLSNNKIARIDVENPSFGELMAIDLSSNLIKEVPNWLLTGACKKLWSLDMYENEISELPQGLERNPMLSSARFGANKIRRVAPEIFSSSSLKKLSLFWNQIEELTIDVGNVSQSLEQLQLAGNRLESVPVGLDALLSLEVLELHNNRISSLKGAKFPQSLRRLTLYGNPIESEELKEYADRYPSVVVESEFPIED